MNILETSSLDARLHVVDSIQWHTSSLAALQEAVAMGCDHGISWQGAVVAVHSDLSIRMLNPSAWEEIIVGLLVEVVKALWGEGAGEVSGYSD